MRFFLGNKSVKIVAKSMKQEKQLTFFVRSNKNVICVRRYKLEGRKNFNVLMNTLVGECNCLIHPLPKRTKTPKETV